MLFRSLILGFLLHTANVLPAQVFSPSLRWMGDIRVRSEVDMRDFNNRTAANTFTLLRTRFALEALPVENVRVFIQARDSRIFGGTGGTIADTRNLDLHQGFIEVQRLFCDHLTLKLGRQELSFGNERIVGTVGWNNVGRTFDGGVLKLENPSIAADFFAMNISEVQAYSAAATPGGVRYVRDLGQDFYGLNITLKNLAPHKVDGYFFYQTHRDTAANGASDLSRFTVGSFAKGKFNAFDYEAELAFQGGKRRGGNVSAYMATGNIGYNIADCKVSRVALGYELLSGTPAGDVKYKSFDPFFATGHKFYGFMDYFTNIPSHTSNLGLVDMFVRTTINLHEKLTANLWIHNFATAQAVNGKKGLGQELDFVALCKYNKSLSFELGVSAFVPDEMMRVKFASADVAFWGYLTTSVIF